MNPLLHALHHATYLENTLNGSKKYWGFMEVPNAKAAIVFWGRIGAKPQSQHTSLLDARRRMGEKLDSGYQGQKFLGCAPSQWVEKHPQFIEALCTTPSMFALWESYVLEQTIVEHAPKIKKTPRTRLRL